MKRLIILLIFFLSVSFAMHAQWGVKGGADYCSISGTNPYSHHAGFHIGATYDYRLSGEIYLQPALLFSLFQFRHPSTDLYNGGKVQKYSLELPLNFSFQPYLTKRTKLVVDAGVFFKYGLAGDYKLKAWEGEGTDYTGSSYDDFNRFDFGFNIGGGVQIQKIYIGASYQYGLINAEQNTSFHNQIIRFSLGYKF